MITAVYDVNIFISGIFWRGAPAEALDEVIEGRVKLLSSDVLVAKLRQVLLRPKFAERLNQLGKTADELIIDYSNFATIVQPAFVPEGVVRDVEDITVLACAVGGQADYIVTGDRHLLELESYQDIPVLRVSDFLKRVK